MNIVDIYCRLQASAEEDFAEQETACRQFAESHGLTVGMVHRDRGSANDLERPGLTALRTRYTSGAIQGVIVKNLDRLFRSTPRLIMLVEEMEAHGVNLYCEDEDQVKISKLIGGLVETITEVEREKATHRLSRRR